MEPSIEPGAAILSPTPSSPLTSLASSDLSWLPRSPTIPPDYPNFQPTPPPSHDDGDNNPPPRKRRRIEVKDRTTQHLDLTSVTAQSEYDRQQSLDMLVKALRGRRKIVVVAGAGISVTAGIPDFRSSHGLFKTLRGEHRLKGSGKQLFDASVYKDDSSTLHFHNMVRRLHTMSADAKPTLFHRLLARLSSEGRLLRLYTQNVDGLETSLPPLATTVPLAFKGPWPQTIQLHGGLEKMTCQKCHVISDFDATLFDSPVPPACPRCVELDDARTNLAGKRSHGIGRLRPRIVLYNEHNPDDEAIGAVTTADFRTRPDAVIVVGTSMKIPGVRRIVSQMCRIVRDRREGTTIWINRDGVPTGKDLENCWDLIVKGDSDDVARLANLREWDDPVQDSPEDYTDSDVEKVRSSQGEVKVVVPSPEKKKPANLAIQNLVTAVMTPPRSHDGDVESRTGDIKAARPIKINLVHNPSKSPMKLKNPASGGRKLSDVLMTKETKAKRGRPKGSLNKKRASAMKGYSDNKTTGEKQGRITGKVSKPRLLAVAATSSCRQDPISPHKEPGFKSGMNKSRTDMQVPSPLQSPQSVPSPTWSHAETISPKGNVPRDMVKLLN